MVSRKGAYRLTIIGTCALLIYFSTVITLSNVVAASAPRIALELWPWNAVAHARVADGLITANQARPPINEVRAHAIAALRRNPTLASAARDLGVMAALRGDMATADRQVQYAERMSRRDVLTQLWLVERRVAANDVSGALVHYGIALQVAPETSELLFPVLAGALNDASLVRPIAGLVRDGPSWSSQFLYFLNTQPVNAANMASLYLLLAQLGTPPASAHMLGLMSRLLRAGKLDEAARVYALADPQWRRGDLDAQLDGGFDHATDLQPFGWFLEPGVATREPRPGAPGNPSLSLTLRDTTSARGTIRTLLLPRGSYRLTGDYGRRDGGGEGALRFELSCAAAGASRSVITAPIPAQNARLDGTLRVDGCDQQWFSIFLERSGEAAPLTVWLDDLRLQPIGGGEARHIAGRR